MANTKPQEEYITNVFHCARCGTDHEMLHFKKFTNPIQDSDNTTWDWWALCPVIKEPILMKQIEKST